LGVADDDADLGIEVLAVEVELGIVAELALQDA